jgi:hypothetical protein
MEVSINGKNALLESKLFSHVMFYAHFNMVRHYICLNVAPRFRSVYNIDNYNISPC